MFLTNTYILILLVQLMFLTNTYIIINVISISSLFDTILIIELIMILLKLAEIRFFLEEHIWPYMCMKSIINLLFVNRELNILCLNINKRVAIGVSFSRNIKIYNDARRVRNLQEGEKVRYLQKMFDTFPIIHTLSFGPSEKFKHCGLSLLCIYLNNNLRINLKSLQVVVLSPESLHGISYIENLTQLDISGSRWLNCRFMTYIAPLKNLQLLNLGHIMRLRDYCLQQLSEMTSLKTLILKECSITDNGLQYLKPLISLTELDLCGCLITDLGLHSLLYNAPNLSIINLGSTNITDYGLLFLSFTFHNITKLNIENTFSITPQGLPALIQLPKLEVLDITGFNDHYDMDRFHGVLLQILAERVDILIF